MERVSFRAGLLILIAAVSGARAQTSLDVIQEDLQAAKLQHDQANSQIMTSLLTALQGASQSAAVALDLYQKAGGSLPDAAPVKNHYEYETPTEKEQRQAIDSQNYQTVAIVIQVHCGLMRNAALLTVSPDKPDVQAQWIVWLKSIAPAYPQLAGRRALKEVAMRDSVVSSYLGFHGWGDGKPGSWTVSDLPKLYHDLVLQPLRQTPTQDTLDAWDTYIAMRQADQTDHDKWTQEDEPELAFDRGSDDFTLQPTMDKLATLDAIIKGNPTSDHLDEWLKRMQEMIAAYRQGGASHSALPGATPGTPSSDASGATPVATPGTAPDTTTTPLPGATPGAPSSAAGDSVPAASPGTPTSGSAGEVPAATPGTPSSAAPGPLPAASPTTPPSGTTVPPTGTP